MFNDYHYVYVEDDSMSREIMRMLMNNVLQVENCTILPDSHDFMVKMDALPDAPDFFLLDIHVPPLDGFGMLKALRANPRYAQARIIALTASVMNEEIEELRQAGFDGAIAKPLSVSTFPEVLERIIKGETVWHIA